MYTKTAKLKTNCDRQKTVFDRIAFNKHADYYYWVLRGENLRLSGFVLFQSDRWPIENKQTGVHSTGR